MIRICYPIFKPLSFRGETLNTPHFIEMLGYGSNPNVLVHNFLLITGKEIVDLNIKNLKTVQILMTFLLEDHLLVERSKSVERVRFLHCHNYLRHNTIHNSFMLSEIKFLHSLQEFNKKIVKL